MPPVGDTSHPSQSAEPSADDRRVSRPYVVAGIVLVALALVWFFTAGQHSAEPVSFEDYVELTPPAAPTADAGRQTTAETFARAGPHRARGRRRPPSTLTRTNTDPAGHAPAPDDGAASQTSREPRRLPTHSLWFEPAPARFADIASASGIFFARPRAREDQTARDPAPGSAQDTKGGRAAAPAPQKPGKARRVLDWLAGRPSKQKRAREETRNFCSVVTLHTSTRVVYTSPGDEAAGRVALKLVGFQPNCDRIVYRWSATGGRIVGEGPEVAWDLSDAAPGTYVAKIRAEAHPDCLYRCEATAPVSVVVRAHPRRPAAPATTLAVDCPVSVPHGQPLEFTARLGGVVGGARPTYQWSVSGGRITGGQGTPLIRVDTEGFEGRAVRASVEAPGRGFTPRGSCTTLVATARLRGEVVYAGDAPAEGARVLVLDNGREVVTNAAGRFDLGLPPGEYRVVASLRNAGDERHVSLPPFSEKFVRFVIPEAAAPAPTATPPPTPTPTPAPTPTPSPPAADDSSSAPPPERYRVAISYPARFPQGARASLKVELSQVGTQASADAGAARFFNASHSLGPASLAQSPAGQFKPFATFGVVADGARVGPVASFERQLGAQPISESWFVETASDSQEVTLTIDLRFSWKSPDGVSHINEVWRRYPFVAVAGPPAREQSFKWLSRLFLLCGLLALCYGLRRAAGGRPGERYIHQVGFGAPQAQPAAAPSEAAAPESDAAAAGTTVADEVHCTVFSPPQAAPGDAFLVQVFAHLAGQAGELEEAAKSSFETTGRRGSKRMGEFERGQVFAFTLEMPGVEIGEPTKTLVWDGAVNFEQFEVMIPEDARPRAVLGKVIYSRVADDGARVPLGHIMFGFKIVAPAPQVAAVSVVQYAVPGPAAAVAPPRALDQEEVKYRRAFISYCSQDRPAVAGRVQAIQAAGVECFMDVKTLKAGENWQMMLYHYIDQSDVFFLFWSQAAEASAEVRKEIEYALRRKDGDERKTPNIIPIPLEGPPIVPPPEELRHLHFADPLLYLNSAAPREGQLRIKN